MRLLGISLLLASLVLECLAQDNSTASHAPVPDGDDDDDNSSYVLGVSIGVGVGVLFCVVFAIYAKMHYQVGAFHPRPTIRLLFCNVRLTIVWTCAVVS